MVMGRIKFRQKNISLKNWSTIVIGRYKNYTGLLKLVENVGE